MYKVILKANGKRHEYEVPDRTKAHEETLRILKFPYSAEAEVWYNGGMIEWLNHSPVSVKRGEEYDG